MPYIVSGGDNDGALEGRRVGVAWAAKFPPPPPPPPVPTTPPPRGVCKCSTFTGTVSVVSAFGFLSLSNPNLVLARLIPCLVRASFNVTGALLILNDDSYRADTQIDSHVCQNWVRGIIERRRRQQRQKRQHRRRHKFQLYDYRSHKQTTTTTTTSTTTTTTITHSSPTCPQSVSPPSSMHP